MTGGLTGVFDRGVIILMLLMCVTCRVGENKRLIKKNQATLERIETRLQELATDVKQDGK